MELQPRNVFTRESGDMIGFYSKHSPLSNHYKCTFTIDRTTYNCVEQYYMYTKATTFKDIEQAAKILESTDPIEQKRLGSKIRGFNKKVWSDKMEAVMSAGLLAKFTQADELKDYLLRTGEKHLIEANANDDTWSCGWSIRDDRVWNPPVWRGKNILGQQLMDVRSRIMNI